MTASGSTTGPPAPMLIVISGPSGVGKDAILSRMRELRKPYHFTITTTTRPRRLTETDGSDYTFVSSKKFRQMIDGGELLEWAEVYENLYGVPKAQVVAALRKGHDVFIKADVQGAATIKTLAADGLFIFIAPPSTEELADRLSLRMTESPEALELRLRTAEAEMAEASKFDYTVVNYRDRLDDTIREIEDIVAKERRKAPIRKTPLLAG